MAAEHCSFGGCDHEFTTGTHKVTTTPRKEWMYIVGDENGQRWECPDMWHGRCIVSIDEYMQRPRVVRAGLNRAEVIALVMESGPMVCSSVLCFFFCATCVLLTSQCLLRQFRSYLTLWRPVLSLQYNDASNAPEYL